MISALGRAQSGMLNASLRMDVAANNIANMSTAGFRPSQVVSVENPEWWSDVDRHPGRFRSGLRSWRVRD